MTMTDSWQQGWGPFQYQGSTSNPTAFQWTTEGGVAPSGYSQQNFNNTQTAYTGVDQSAKSFLTAQLEAKGLGSLADWAWKKWQAGEGIDQIFLELKDTTEFKTRYPALAALEQAGHAISVDQYLQLEQTYIQIGRQYGLPSSFYDQPSDFTALIAGQVSPTEYQQRVQDYSTWAYEVDPAIRDQLQRLYGVDVGHIAAFAMDPDKALPILQRQFGATQAAAAASRSGFGDLGLADAESISGIAPDALQQGFGTLYAGRELLGVLPGEAGQGVSTQTALGATFLGDAAAANTLDTVARKRKAAFDGGTGFAQSEQGIAGAG